MADRIQKVLADFGLGSRRQIDRWVIEGRVTIDGRAARPGEQLTGRERICVDGRPVQRSAGRHVAKPSFAAYYKPAGRSAARTPSERPRVAAGPERPKRGRWIAVNALDTSATGLLVLTTDGALANDLARVRAPVPREYAVRLLGEPTPSQIERVTHGVTLVDGGEVRPESFAPAGGSGGTNVWYHAVLGAGGSRELRALLDAANLNVSRVICTRYGPISLGTLRRGQSRPLVRAEIDALHALVGTPKERTSRRPAGRTT